MSSLRALSVAVLLGAVGLAGCEKKPPPDQKPAAPAATPAPLASAKPVTQVGGFTAGNADNGKKLVEQFECSRCHEGTGVASAPMDKHCNHCHQEILAGKFKAPAAVVAKWKPNVDKYREVPSLTSIGKRLMPEWIEGYLLEPHDLRPHLIQNMPRLKLTKEQARDIVTYLVKDELGKPSAPAGPEGDSSVGRELF